MQVVDGSIQNLTAQMQNIGNMASSSAAARAQDPSMVEMARKVRELDTKVHTGWDQDTTGKVKQRGYLPEKKHDPQGVRREVGGMA